MQEVWIVSLVRGPVFSHEKAVRSWLAQVCRRVVANDRRARAKMLTFAAEPELPVAPSQEQHIEDGLDNLQRRAALARLSDAQLDVLTLYASGGISMREVAHLIGAPEPTVYSWYRAAVDAVSGGSFRERGAHGAVSDEGVALEQALPIHALDREARGDNGDVVVYRQDEGATLARMGNVIVSRWRDRVAARTAAGLASVIDLTAQRMGGPVVLLNDLRAELPPPDATERKTLRDAIRYHSEYVEMVVVLGHVTNTRSLVLMVEGTLAVTGISTAFTLARSLAEVGARVAPLARTKQGPFRWERVVKNFELLERRMY